MPGYTQVSGNIAQAKTTYVIGQPKAQEFDHGDIFWRMTKNAHITPEERAAFLAKHPKALVCYTVDNNPANANNTLRHEKGFEMLPYAPDKKQILAQITLHISKDDLQPMNDVINGFKFNQSANNWTTEPNLVAALREQKVIK